MILPHALHLQAEHGAFDFGVENATDNVSVARPEMEKTLVVFAGDGVLRIGKVEGDGTVFDDDRGARSVEKIGEHTGERVGSHG